MSIQQQRNILKFASNTIMLFGIVAIISYAALALWFGSALGQEPDTLRILVSAARLHLNKTAIEPVGTSPDRWLARNHESIVKMMEEKGWKFTDQMGSILIFSKQNSTTEILCRMYSKKYVICESRPAP